MMKHKPYTEYKDSGIQWIGKIPEGWEVRRGSSFGFFSSSGINKKTEPDEALIKMVNYTDIYGNNSLVIDSKRELMTVSCPKGKVIYCNLKKGDIVFTPSSETEEDIGLSAVVLEDLQNTVFSYHVIRFRPIINISLLYKKYIGNNHFVLSQFSRTCKGTTRQILTHNDFRNILMILPPPPEQATIASFLDKKTAKIDKLIEKDKKLIELLKEKRTALINHTVTKGLDPNARMKESGVEWIGKIPEGWEVRKVKYIGKSIIGLTYSPDEISDNKGILVLRASNIKNNKINLADKVYVNKNIPKEKLTHMGDILICSRSGSKALIGKNACIYKNNTGHSFGVFTTVFRTRYWKFISYVFNSIIFYSQLNSCLTTTINQLTIESLNNILVLFPDISTQNHIIDFLDKETGMIDKTIKLIEQKIKLLEEYKKSLIHHTVTGKIDVRGVKV